MITEKLTQFDKNNFHQLESLNKNIQLLEMPALVVNIYKAIEKLHIKNDAMTDYMIRELFAKPAKERYFCLPPVVWWLWV